MVGHATQRVVNLRERVEVRASGHELRCAAVAIAAEIRAREHHHEGLLREVFLRGRDGAAPPLLSDGMVLKYGMQRVNFFLVIFRRYRARSLGEVR